MKSSQWDPHLASALEELRAADGHVAAPPHVEAAVLAAWDRAHPSPAVAGAQQPMSFVWWQRVAAVAAAAAMAIGLAQLGRALQHTARPSAVADDSGTLLLVGEPILQGEPMRVVRMRIPASTLIGLGVRAGSDVAQVDVDVIVGEDGVARAIRVGM
jgi:hypothetical protein